MAARPDVHRAPYGNRAGSNSGLIFLARRAYSLRGLANLLRCWPCPKTIQSGCANKPRKPLSRRLSRSVRYKTSNAAEPGFKREERDSFLTVPESGRQLLRQKRHGHVRCRLLQMPVLLQKLVAPDGCSSVIRLRATGFNSPTLTVCTQL
jgi:hypothetical protein